MESQFEALDAFIDGERVDAAALKRALADADGRDYFVDAWLLREGVHEDMALESVVVPAAAARGRGLRTWLVAAAALVLCLAGGYAAGYRTANLRAPAAPSSGKETVASQPPAGPKTAFPAPVPTRVIQVDFGSAPAAGPGEN